MSNFQRFCLASMLAIIFGLLSHVVTLSPQAYAIVTFAFLVCAVGLSIPNKQERQ